MTNHHRYQISSTVIVTHFCICCLLCTLAAIFFLHKICTLTGPGWGRDGNHCRGSELPGFWLVDGRQWRPLIGQLRAHQRLEVMPRMRRDRLQTRASCSQPCTVHQGRPGIVGEWNKHKGWNIKHTWQYDNQSRKCILSKIVLLIHTIYFISLFIAWLRSGDATDTDRMMIIK